MVNLGEEKERERGAILVFLLLALVVILGMIGFAVDYNSAVTVKDQANIVARACAVAALDEFYQVTGDVSRRYNAALVKCGGGSPNLAQGGVGLGGKSVVVEADTSSNPNTLKLEFGSWTTNGVFRAIPSGRLNDELHNVNAARVRGTLPGGYLMGISRNILGAKSLSLNASAVSSVTPRRGCFLVDVSGSMTLDSHPKDRALFAFSGSVKSASPPSPPATGLERNEELELWKGLGGTRQNPNSTIFRQDDYVLIRTLGNDDWSADDFKYSPKPEHFRYNRPPDSGGGRWPDYSIVDANGVPANTTGIEYLIDAPVQQSGVSYLIDPATGKSVDRRPEPLGSVFDALNGAMRLYQRRRVAGDEACIIFYDKNVDWARTVKLTSDFDYLVELTDFDKQLRDIRVEGRGGPAAPPTNIFKRGIFPGEAGFSDTTAAAQEAMNQLLGIAERGTPNPPQIPTSDFIVFMGDGLPNCARCNNAWEDTLDTCSNQIPGVSSRCLDATGHWRQALANLSELWSLPRWGFRANKVQLNVIMIGEAVMPHSFDIPKFLPGTGCERDSDSCYDDVEFRKFWFANDENKARVNACSTMYDLSTVMNPWSEEQFTGSTEATAFADKNKKGHPFFRANSYMYRFAAATGGIFGPVRPIDPICTDGDGAGLPPRTPVKAEVCLDPHDSDCTTIRSDCMRIDGRKIEGCTPAMYPGCTKAKSRLWCYEDRQGVCKSVSATDPDQGMYYEREGIRSKDPYCRTPSEQMIVYMQQILTKLPISLVNLQGS